ncbi:ABC transporter ATP-binding protein [Neobacillus sp. Marseille-QA0830]
MIQLSNLDKEYFVEGEKISVLKNINLNIAKGEFIAIMGRSGSGKSTLLNILGLLDNDYHGVFLLEGRDITKQSDKEISKLRNHMIGFVFQKFNLLDRYTIYENLQLPLLYSNHFISRKRDILLSLDQVGIKDKANKYPAQLSGGQLQRAAIARAIINNPELIIADEPTGALDSKTSEEIMRIFKRIHENGTTIILVTHDQKIADYAEKTIFLSDGIITQMV